MTGTRIRQRDASDLSACVDALAEVHRTDGYPVNWPADPGGWLTPHGLLGAWVAVAGGVVAGHVALQDGAGVEPLLAEAVESPLDRLASVSRLFVTPGAQGHGLATNLLAEAGRYASRRGLRLVLDVAEDSQAAIRLYERAGWRRVASSRPGWLAATGEQALVHHYVSPGDLAPSPT